MPKVVHPAIRWSKHDPLLKSQTNSYDFSQLRLNLKNAALPAKLKHSANCKNMEVSLGPSSMTLPNSPATLLLRAVLAPPSQGVKCERSESITDDEKVSSSKEQKMQIRQHH